MKRAAVWGVGLFLCVMLGKGVPELLGYGPLYKVDSFHIFYAKPDQKKLKELAEQDAVIMEPTAFKLEDVRYLKKQDVQLFGYVSLMQLENWNEELKERIKEEDYARIDRERIYIQEWDTYVMDLREENYQEALLWKINKYAAEMELTGVFFDTVDDLDYYFRDDPEVQEQMRDGYGEILAKLEERHPDLLVIQNRGFDTYRALSRKKIDGLLWEGFKASEIKSSDWTKQWLAYFQKEQRWGKVRLMTVVTDEESRITSENKGFPAFVRTGDTYQ